MRHSILAMLISATVLGGTAQGESWLDKKSDDKASKAKSKQAAADAAKSSAQWTIYCQTIMGDDHVARANRVKEQLISVTKLKDWYVVHQDGQSLLYYGMYKTFNDPNESDSLRAQKDRAAIDVLADELGNRPFKHSFFVSLDAPDPTAPPEWNLVNADGVYTLQIGAYTGNKDRKQAAVSAVRDARAAGLEAYYFHGETTSSVCLGAFPANAIMMADSESNSTGDPEQSFLKSTEPLPDAIARNLRDTDNKPVKVVQSKPRVTDEKLLELMRRFPEHAINGEVQIVSMSDAKTGKPVQRPAESFVVPIPRSEPLALDDAAMQPAAPDPNMQPVRQPRRGEGKLKSIGE